MSGQFLGDLWWTNWCWDRFSSRYSLSPLSIALRTHLYRNTTHHTTIGQILVDLQLDAQNSYLFAYNTFIKIFYVFRALFFSSSGGLRRNCIYAASGIVTLCWYMLVLVVWSCRFIIPDGRNVFIQFYFDLFELAYLSGLFSFTNLDNWLNVHYSITLVVLQLDVQNSYLFTYNTFIKILYMFRALLCSSSGGLRRNCTGWPRSHRTPTNKLP
jgi:hypothetical protein